VVSEGPGQPPAGDQTDPGAGSWTAAISGNVTIAVHSIPNPSDAPATEYVVMPLGSSSEAPVTSPGPSIEK